LHVTNRSLWSAVALIAIAIAPAWAQTPEASFDQGRALAELRKSIEGQEDKPAVDVFMNITQYKGVTAERLLRIMEFGFTKSLGVNCTHCHVPGKWDSDEKGAKETARAMSRMVIAINGEYLKNIPSLNSANPSVNCTTCHRGQKRPALEMPEPAAAPAAR
jgi:Photosynthetic reaction centre cytochrome C subunit